MRPTRSGATPGITNVMACRGADQPDEVDDIQIILPPHAMRLAKSMLESGLYSEEPLTVKGGQDNGI